MLQDKIITIDNTKENRRIAESLAHKILWVVFVLSFMWLELFSSLLAFNAVSIKTDVYTTFIIELLISGAFSAVLCAALFWIYRLLLHFSLYSLLIPDFAIKDSLKWHFIVRNIVMGALYFLCIYCPYIYNFLPAIDALIIFIVFFLHATRLCRLYVDKIVVPYAFRALLRPLIIYEFAILVINYMGWLL